MKHITNRRPETRTLAYSRGGALHTIEFRSGVTVEVDEAVFRLLCAYGRNEQVLSGPGFDVEGRVEMARTAATLREG